jgi:hypothetical protein
MQTRIATLEAERASRETAATEERIRLQTEKGQAVEAVRTLRDQKDAELATERTARSAIEERAKRYALDGTLSRVLASQPLVPYGAEQLLAQWRSQFVVEAAGDSFTVRTPTFQSVEDFVAAELAKPNYAHFIKAKNPDGGVGGATGGGNPAPTGGGNTAPQAVPKTLQEAILMDHQAKVKAMTSEDPRFNTRLPMGFTVKAG